MDQEHSAKCINPSEAVLECVFQVFVSFNRSAFRVLSKEFCLRRLLTSCLIEHIFAINFLVIEFLGDVKNLSSCCAVN